MENRVALITGASSGIGKVYATKLAEKKVNLILTARRKEKLLELKNQLTSQYKIDVTIIIADLATQEGIKSVADQIKQTKELYYLINNAGFVNLGKFHNIPFEKHQNLLSVHMLAPTQLTHAALPVMIENNAGVIINVASIAAFLRNRSLYGITKQYLVEFSKYIRRSVKGYNIVVQALCPGLTYSEFHKTEEYISNKRDPYTEIPKAAWMTSEKVVEISIKAIKKKKIVVIPGYKNRFGYRLVNLAARILRR